MRIIFFARKPTSTDNATVQAYKKIIINIFGCDSITVLFNAVLYIIVASML